MALLAWGAPQTRSSCTSSCQPGKVSRELPERLSAGGFAIEQCHHQNSAKGIQCQLVPKQSQLCQDRREDKRADVPRIRCGRRETRLRCRVEPLVA
jgi:hypothetical protein